MTQSLMPILNPREESIFWDWVESAEILDVVKNPNPGPELETYIKVKRIIERVEPATKYPLHDISSLNIALAITVMHLS